MGCSSSSFSLQNIQLIFGGTRLLEGAKLIVQPSQRIALVGRNGSGKSTLLKIASGGVAHDAGLRFVEPRATLRYLPQEHHLSAYSTTLDYVKDGLGQAMTSIARNIYNALAGPDRVGRPQDPFWR